MEKATLAVEPARSGFAAESDAEILVTMEIDAGWHTNSHQPTYDYLIPTEIAVTVPEGWDEASVAYPPGELKTFAFTEEEPISVYEGSVLMVVTQPVPATADGATESEIALTYQACDDKSCLPPVTTTSVVELAIGEEGAGIGP